MLFQPDHPMSVGQGRSAAAGCEPANRLVRDGEADPDDELNNGIRRPPGKGQRAEAGSPHAVESAHVRTTETNMEAPKATLEHRPCLVSANAGG